MQSCQMADMTRVNNNEAFTRHFYGHVSSDNARDWFHGGGRVAQSVATTMRHTRWSTTFIAQKVQRHDKLYFEYIYEPFNDHLM